MRRVDEQVLKTAKVAKLPLVILVFAFAFAFMPLATASAEDTPDTNPDPANQTVNPVQSPGMPSATSAGSDYNIVWVWAAPSGGLTPDTPPVDPDATDQNPVEQPTDITQYGYQLSQQGNVITSGSIDSSSSTVTTTVTGPGDYTFSVWSITRSGASSDQVSGFITITAPAPAPDPPVVAPIDDTIIPDPIDTTPLTNTSIPTTQLHTPAVSNTTNNSSDSTSTSGLSSTPNSSVLSANTVADTLNNVAKSGVAKTSSEGWVIVGIPWYIWLFVLAVLFAAWRFMKVFVFRRRAILK